MISSLVMKTAKAATLAVMRLPEWKWFCSSVCVYLGYRSTVCFYGVLSGRSLVSVEAV